MEPPLRPTVRALLERPAGSVEAEDGSGGFGQEQERHDSAGDQEPGD